MNDNKTSLFYMWIHRFGIASSAVILVGMIGFPVVISLLYGIWPDFREIWPGLVAVILFMMPWLPGEVVGYMPVMGPGALYMSAITGNITNLRMPATVGTINTIGIEPNTDACHTMAMLVCGGSILISTVLVAAGMLLANAAAPVLEQDFLQPAFNYVVPALFGGLVAQTVLKGKKTFAFYLIPLAICLFCSYFTNMSSSAYMLIAIAVTAVIYALDYKGLLIGNGMRRISVRKQHA